MKPPYQLGEHQYVIGQLNPIKQFHITRRLAPALATLGLSVAQLKELRGIDELSALLGPLSGVMAAMKDDDAEYILFTCLGVVSRLASDGRAARITVAGDNTRLMFEDIQMPQMLMLTFQVIKENMAGFMQELGVLAASTSSSPEAG